MPRKRIIDPEFWSDEEISSWPYEARLFYIALWNFADDEGRLKAHPNLLRSQIFPYEQKIDIEKLKEIVSCKVKWYSVNGSQYGIVSNLLKHQYIERPKPSKIPIGDESVTNRGSIGDESVTNRGLVTPNRIERKGKEECGDESPTPVVKEELSMEKKVNEVFEYFLLKTNKELSLTKERKALIVKCIKEGRIRSDFFLAIDNFCADDWPDRYKYLDFVYVFGVRRGVNNFDRWLNAKPNKKKEESPYADLGSKP